MSNTEVFDANEESAWSSSTCSDSGNESEDSKVEVYAIKVLPQIVSESMNHLKDLNVVPMKEAELLKQVKFALTSSN